MCPFYRGELVGSWSIVTGDAAFKAFHLYKYDQVMLVATTDIL